MDIGALLSRSQYALPVGIVLVCAILVFAFGFKKAEQPPFAQLSAGSDVDRKSAGKKRGKIKEKRSVNGQVTTEKSSPAKKVSAAKSEPTKKAATKLEDAEAKLKERKQDDNNRKTASKKKNQDAVKSGKENKVEQTKNKKNLKNLVQEKPVDFDEGDWVEAYSRKDKKNKKKEEELPAKKKKSEKKYQLITTPAAKEKDLEKPEIKDKVAKETENNELKEKNKKDIILTPISNDEMPKETAVEEKEEANKPEKVEKEEKKKAKKAKKSNENDASATIVPKTESKNTEKMEQPLEKDNKIVSEESKSEKVPEKVTAVFDELADVWTKAKPQKKSKKKARKDN